METKRYLLAAMACSLLGGCLVSCISNDDDDETEQLAWKTENEEFIDSQKELTVDGVKYYETYAPVWSPLNEILIHWHNDRTLTQNNLVPLSNSTVDVKYDVTLYDGTEADDSYSLTQYGDSIYRTKPNNNIIGMHALLTTMHVGDSVTCVMPAASAYGNVQSGVIKPYSALIFNVKLVDVKAWERPI